MALMDNLETAEEARTKAINSENSAMDEQRKYLDSITGRLGTLKATIEEKYMESLSSDFLKNMVTGATDLADALLNVKNVILVLVSALFLWKGVGISNVLKLNIALFAQFARTTGVANASMIAGAAATSTLKGAFTSLWAVVSANPLGAIVTVVTAIIFALDIYKQKTQEVTEAQKRRNDELLKEQELLAKVASYYNDNYEKIDSDKQVKQEMLALQEDLNKAFGDEANKIDLVNGKYKEQKQLIDKLNIDQLTKALNEMSLQVDEIEAKRYSKVGMTDLGYTQKIDYGVEIGESMKSTVPEEDQQTLKERKKSLEKMLETIRNSGKEEVYNLKTAKDKNKAINKLKDKLDEVANEESKIQNYMQVQKDLVEKNAVSAAQFTENSKAAYEILSKKIEFKSQEDFGKELKDLVEYLTTGNFKNIEKQFAELDAQVSTGEITWEKYNEQVEEIKKSLGKRGFTSDEITSLFKFQSGLERVDLTIEELDENFEKTNDAFEANKDKISLLDKALKELEDDEKLSAETTMELIQNYPKLNNNLDDTASLVSELSSLYNEEADSAKESYKETLEASEEFYTNLKEANDDLFSAFSDTYKKDLLNFQTLQQAKTDLQNKLFLLTSSQNLNEYKESLQAAGKKATPELILEFKNKEEVITQIRQTIGEINGYIDSVGENVDFSRVENEIEKLNDAFDDLLSNLKLIAGAIEELSDEESLNAETALELIEKYPQLGAVMGDQAALLNQLKGLHKQEANAARQAYISKLANNEQFLKSMITNNEEFWGSLKSAYTGDLNNWADYLLAKQKMSEEAAKVIGKNWEANVNESLNQIDEYVSNIPSFMEGAPIEKQYLEVQSFVSHEAELRNKINNLIKDVKFDEIGFSDAYLNPEKQKEANNLTKVTAEKYNELYLALYSVNNAIEKNKTLQELSSNDMERKNYLEKEIELLKNKDKALNDLQYALKEEQKQNIKNLNVKYGVTFTSDGSLANSNIDDILAREEANVNKLAANKQEDAYKKAKDRFDALNDLFDRAKQLESEDIFSLKNEREQLKIRKNEIENIFEDMEFTGFEKLNQQLARNLEIADEEIANLNNELSLIDSDNYEEKFHIMGLITEATIRKQKTLKDNMQTLKNTNYEYGKSNKAVEITLLNLNSTYDEITQSIKTNNKAVEDLKEEQKEAYQSQVDAAIEQYIDSINQKIEEEIEQYEKLSDIESELADQQLKSNKKKIDDLNEELNLLKEIDNQKDTEREKNEYDEKIAKQKEMIANLEKEQTQRIYMEGQGWVWTVDVKKIEEEQDNLKEMLLDYDDWEREQKIASKEKEVEVIEEANNKIVKKYEDEIEALKSMLIDSADIIATDRGIVDSWDELLEELSKYENTFFSSSMKNLETFLGGFGDKFKDLDIDTSFFDDTLNKIDYVNQALKVYETTSNQKTERKDFTSSEISDMQQFEEFENLPTPKDENYEYYKTQMMKNSAAWIATNDIETKNALAKQNEIMGEQLGWTKKNGAWYDKGGKRVYENGGLVDFTGLAWLDGTKSSPERVLSSDQNKIFNQLATTLPTIAQTNQNNSRSEVYEINIGTVQSNNALEFINNLKKLTYGKGRGI